MSHPARHFYENDISERRNPVRNGTIVRWDSADQLADVFLATFGAYPSKEEIGLDYDSLFKQAVGREEFVVAKDAAVQAALFKAFTPSTLTAQELEFSWGSFVLSEGGLYWGASNDFTDLVNFWNLRACGLDLHFYDPAVRSRVFEFTDRHLARLRERPKDQRGRPNRIAIWKKSHDMSVTFEEFGSDLVLPSFSPDALSRLNLKVGFEEKSVLGIASDEGRVSATFELPPKPFYDEREFYMQKVVVSVHPLLSDENIVLQPPFLPLLNEYYGHEIHSHNSVRSEPEGVGVVVDLTDHSLSLRALDVRTLVSRIFEAFGITANPSPPGLVGSRLIEQMGGLQDCRVFKLSGVRNLIKKNGPEMSFTRTCATGAIGKGHPPKWSDAEKRFFGKPADVFVQLVKKGVFRAGLRFTCESCELESWVHLDDARTISRCEYCGKDFNVTPQLKDRDWAFRRSGLFGRDDNQGGGIPVALTLLQLRTALHHDVVAYTTGTELIPTTADIKKCETDFVLIAESPGESKPQIVVGECKSDGGEIMEDDVRKLGLVADALAKGGACEAFVVFSKTGNFTADEIARCKLAQARYGSRVILFSARELEEHHAYAQAATEFDIHLYANSLERMAQATQGVYFDPRPKAKQGP